VAPVVYVLSGRGSSGSGTTVSARLCGTQLQFLLHSFKSCEMLSHSVKLQNFGIFCFFTQCVVRSTRAPRHAAIQLNRISNHLMQGRGDPTGATPPTCALSKNGNSLTGPYRCSGIHLINLLYNQLTLVACTSVVGAL